MAGARHGRLEGDLPPRRLQHRRSSGGDQGCRAARTARRQAVPRPMIASERSTANVKTRPASIAAMPKKLRSISLALFLAGAALAAAGCGGDSDPDPSISQEEASALVSRIQEIEANVEAGSCLVAADRTDELIAEIDDLPDSVNDDVKSALDNGANNLKLLLRS